MLWGPLPPAPGAVQVDEVVWQPSAFPYLPLDVNSSWEQTGLFAFLPLTQQMGQWPGLQLDGGIASMLFNWDAPMSAAGTPYWQATQQHGQVPGAQHIGASAAQAGVGSMYQVAQAVQPTAAGTAATARTALLNMWSR